MAGNTVRVLVALAALLVLLSVGAAWHAGYGDGDQHARYSRH